MAGRTGNPVKNDRLRRERELKQEELADKLDISGQAVSKWENDQTCPDISALPKLAEILGVTVDELLTGKTEETLPAVRMLPPDQRKDVNDMILRIIADDGNGNKARLNLPMGLVSVVLEAGFELPKMEDCPTIDLRSIDFERVMHLAHQGFVGNLMEAESANGGKVCIFVE